MSKVEAIEQAIQSLPAPELAKFRSWFIQFDAGAWDSQIEVDAVSGKLDSLASEALAEYHNGKAREL